MHVRIESTYSNPNSVDVYLTAYNDADIKALQGTEKHYYFSMDHAGAEDLETLLHDLGVSNVSFTLGP